MSDAATDRARRVDRGLVALMIAFFIGVGVAAVDYGDSHWDEPVNVRNVLYGVDQRVPFPARYYYGTTLPFVLVVAAVPDFLTEGLDAAGQVMLSKPYRLRARSLLIVLSALVVMGTWSLARGLGRSRGEALFATALVATSWQLGTHARFIAPDGLLAALTTGAMATLAWAPRAADLVARRWRLLAAAALVGVAAGTKYSAGILLVPVLVECARGPLGTRARAAVLACAASGAGFFASTPGALFEPDLVLAGLRFQSAAYGAGFANHTVSGPADMLATLGKWLAFTALSPFEPVAAVLLGLAVVGVWGVMRRREGPESMAAAFTPWLMLPLTLALYLPQHMFVARAFFGFLPFLAVLAAGGGALVVHVLARRHRLLGGAAVAVGVSLVLANAGFGVWAADTVRNRSVERTVADVSAFVRAHDEETFVASPAVRSALADAPNLVAEPSSSTRRLIALPGELFVPWEWPCCDPFLVDRVIGPMEIDWPWSPAWIGPSRAVVMDVEKARRLGASLSFQPTPRGPPPRLPEHILEGR